MNEREKTRVAVLHQAIDPPVINGVKKPMKPGGYQDSGADIAYALQSQSQISALTPIPSPSPADSAGWTFPDAEAGIVSALKAGATHLWANTILFSSHPLQTSPLIAKHQNAVHVIGQPQNMVEQFDDKDYVNNFLRSQKTFTLPRGWTIHNSENLSSQITELSLLYPVVAKPIRGRGSHGVKVCHSQSELLSHIWSLFAESPTIMIEEYLSGEEAAVTVMSPSSSRPNYWALPIVTRFNHQFGIAPYNGVVAVTANSRVISSEEYAADARYGVAARECEAVAKLLKVTAPIRIDIRRFSNQPDSKFALFDVNMKPNLTGPGRPGREDQESLTALAAAELGWDYARLLREMLESSRSLRETRDIRHVTGS